MTTARWVEVGPERIGRWLAGFEERHGPAAWAASATEVVGAAPDGAGARCEVPFPPMTAGADPRAALVAHALVERRFGVLLVRLGGYAAGVFEGQRLITSKVGSRQVHGRSAAGGQSQQRFARRREGQVTVALAAAADNAARILLPAAGGLAGLVVGGDRSAVDKVLADRRLAALLPLLTGSLLDVPDPRHDVLLTAGTRARAVRIGLQEADSAVTRNGPPR